MRIRVKKQNPKEVQRIEAEGDIRDILINQDFMEPSKVSVSLCFRGNHDAGIVDLTPEEIGMINKEIISKKKLLKGVKVMKFEK